jgi:hypothetical protein
MSFNQRAKGSDDYSSACSASAAAATFFPPFVFFALEVGAVFLEAGALRFLVGLSPSSSDPEASLS